MDSVQWHAVLKRLDVLQQRHDELLAKNALLNSYLTREQNTNAILTFKLKRLEAEVTDVNRRFEQCSVELESLKRAPWTDGKIDRHNAGNEMSLRLATDGGTIRQFECYLCGATFSRYVDLAKHMANTCFKLPLQPQVPAAQGHVCTGCDREFESRQMLDSHQSGSSRMPFYKCHAVNCGSVYRLRCMLRKHICQPADGLFKMFICAHDGCGKGYPSQSHLKRHLLSHQPNGDASVHFDRAQYTPHRRSTISGQAKSYPCTHAGCDKSFSSQGNLNRHTIAHHSINGASTDAGHPEVPPSTHCKQLAHKHARSTSLAEARIRRSLDRSPMAKQNGTAIDGQAKSYPCTRAGCDKSFSSQGNLTRHTIALHMNNGASTDASHSERPSSTQQSAIKRARSKSVAVERVQRSPDRMSKRICRPSNGQAKWFSCARAGCDKSFPSEGNRNLHTLSHQSIIGGGGSVNAPHRSSERSPSALRRRSSTYKRTLSTVMVTDQYMRPGLEKSHTCHGCGMLFHSSSVLKRHIRRPTGSKLFECDYPDCGRGYILQCILTRHQLYHGRPAIANRPANNVSAIVKVNGDKDNDVKPPVANGQSNSPPKETMLVCPQVGCGKVFQLKQQLIRHRYEHVVQHVPNTVKPASNGIDNMFCDFRGCERRIFTNKLSLGYHMKTHRDHHICPVVGCGESFQHLNGLERHMQAHKGVKPFLCDFPDCGNKYLSNRNLVRHQKQHIAQLNGSAVEVIAKASDNE